MSADETTFDLDAAVSAAAGTISEIFGLGDEQTVTGAWPIDEGDRVLAFAFSGDVSGVLLLAVNDEVAARLESDPGRLANGFAKTLAAVAASTGTSLELGEAGGHDRAPSQTVEIADTGRLCALVGLALDVATEAAADPDAAGVAPGAAADPGAGTQAPQAAAPAFEPAPVYTGGPYAGGPVATPLNLLHDVDMEVTVELGRTTMPIRDLLALQPGMVVEIDRAAGGPIDVLVNGRLIACGEVVVIDEEFGIRITEIVTTGAHS